MSLFAKELKDIGQAMSLLSNVAVSLGMVTDLPVPPAPAPTPAPPVRKYRVKLESITGAKGEFLEFVKKALVLNEEILNSQDFYEEMMKKDFGEDRGHSQQKIYDVLVSGGTMYEKPDSEWNYYIRCYSGGAGTYAYVQNDDNRVHLNRYYYTNDGEQLHGNALGLWALCNTLSHELGGHQTGYSHWEGFDNSVPYGIGEIFEDLAKKVINKKLILRPLVQKQSQKQRQYQHIAADGTIKYVVKAA